MELHCKCGSDTFKIFGTPMDPKVHCSQCDALTAWIQDDPTTSRLEAALREIADTDGIKHTEECSLHQNQDEPPYLKRLMIRIGHRCCADIAREALKT
jgi:hypothetical protein